MMTWNELRAEVNVDIVLAADYVDPLVPRGRIQMGLLTLIALTMVAIWQFNRFRW